MLLLVLVLSLGSEDGELLKDEFEFRPIVLDLGLEIENVPITGRNKIDSKGEEGVRLGLGNPKYELKPK